MLLEDKDKQIILNQVPWEKLRNKSIFLIGGFGYLSKWVKLFVKFANDELNLNINLVILTTRGFANNNDSNFRYIVGDIRDFQRFYPSKKYFGNIDYVIHAACPASSKFNENAPVELLDILINGTNNLLRQYQDDKNVRILYLSSGAVYANNFYPANEKRCSNGFDYINQPSAYIQGKITAEMLCSIYNKQYGLNTLIARIFATFGPYMGLDSGFAAMSFIKSKINNKPIFLNGNAKNVIRSYLYPVDVVTWLFNILIDGKVNYPYNVGSEHQHLLTEVAESVGCPIEYVLKNVISNAGNVYWPNSGRIKDELKVKENYTLKEMIEKTYNFYKEIE